MFLNIPITYVSLTAIATDDKSVIKSKYLIPYLFPLNNMKVREKNRNLHERKIKLIPVHEIVETRLI